MNNNQLSLKIKALRKSKGLTQEALAKTAGLSLRTIQRIENENKNPSGDTLKRLSTSLNVSPDYLIEWEPNESINFLLILVISPIFFIINPFLAVLVPLILWASKRNNIKGVNSLGVKIMSVQIIWLIVYFTSRTINFLRLNHNLNNKTVIVGEEEFDSYLSDFKTQFYLKSFFIVINVLIILFMAYKTYKKSKLTS